MSDRNFKIYAAPLQGFTETAWRRAHAEVAGGIDEYFAPFSRVEKGAVRRRDLRDYAADGECGFDVTPQAIFRDGDELRTIIETMANVGASRLDLNMGCPFPPQVKKGRGAAMIERGEALEEIVKILECYPEMSFSAKMRLGISDRTGWRDAADIIGNMPLRHLTVHPRTASQQYAGDLYMDELELLMSKMKIPVVFNGDILSPSDIDRVVGRFQGIAGVMIGRGLLARPTLAAEWRAGRENDNGKVRQTVMQIHDRILDEYRATLCGESQILMKIKPFWTYPSPLLPRSVAKAIHKASSLRAYMAALSACD